MNVPSAPSADNRGEAAMASGSEPVRHMGGASAPAEERVRHKWHSSGQYGTRKGEEASPASWRPVSVVLPRRGGRGSSVRIGWGMWTSGNMLSRLLPPSPSATSTKGSAGKMEGGHECNTQAD